LKHRSQRTFTAANTPLGFSSLFEELMRGKDVYVIKGGPGTGKSSLMKRVAAEAVTRGYETEYIYCSSDVDSLDAVYIKQLNTVICDGTAPHTADVKYPGAAGSLINIFTCWDEELLRSSKDDIIRFNGDIAAEYSRVYKHLAAAAQIYSAITAEVEKHTDMKAIDGFARELAKKTVPKKRARRKDPEKRYLSALTPNGFVTFYDTIYTAAEKVYVFKDRFGLCANALKQIEERAADEGYDVTVFYDPLRPKVTAHVIIPELKLCFATSGPCSDIEPISTKRINVEKRFTDGNLFLVKNRISLYGRLMKGCITEAAASLGRAKALHDDLEDIYIRAMDFDKLSALTENTIKKIFLN